MTMTTKKSWWMSWETNEARHIFTATKAGYKRQRKYPETNLLQAEIYLDLRRVAPALPRLASPYQSATPPRRIVTRSG